MTHVNAPLTPTGRLRMVLRHIEDGIPKAHVAAEFRVSRPTVATWVARYLAAGEAGLVDRPSIPRRSQQRTPAVVVKLIESLRRERKWSARRIHHHLLGLGHQLHLRTVGRWLHRLGISRLRDLTPAGENARRTPARIRAAWPGHMVVTMSANWRGFSDAQWRPPLPRTRGGGSDALRVRKAIRFRDGSHSWSGRGCSSRTRRTKSAFPSVYASRSAVCCVANVRFRSA